MQQGNYKISFCVVCMNRLHQLQQTLIKNIIDNNDYDDLEFVVLDYNSNDGMEDWAKEELGQYILSDRLVYYKTTQPQLWSPSHSKNLAFKLATGDIVCSIWADYYTGAGFATYVNNLFKQDNNIVLTPIDFYRTKSNYHPPGDVLGKVCVKKSDFEKIKGFDERMNKHGFEDYDFINRLEMAGVKRVLIEDLSFLQYIAHDNKERYTLSTENLESMYINYLSPSVSAVLLLYKDNSYKKGVLVDNFTSHAYNHVFAYQPNGYHFEYSLQNKMWQTGLWNIVKNELHLNGTNDNLRFINNGKSLMPITEAGDTFYLTNDAGLINSVLEFEHFFDTRSLMEDSLDNEKMIVNTDSYGSAPVFKNFKQTPHQNTAQPKLHRIDFLKPVAVNNKSRIGPQHDGGYVVYEPTLKQSTLLTYGVGWDVRFEEAFNEKTHNAALMLDPTMYNKWMLNGAKIIKLLKRLQLKKLIEYIVFTKNFWVKKQALKKRNVVFINEGIDIQQNGKYNTLANHLREYDLLDKEVLLKIDVEGKEYDIFENEESFDHLNNVSQILIEFHDLQTKFDRFEKIIERFKVIYDIVHIHGNNCGKIFNLNKSAQPGDGFFIHFPDVVELTLVKREKIAAEDLTDKKENYPIRGLDFPNQPGRKDYSFYFSP